VSAVCLEASLLALLVRKLFSIRNLFLLCELRVQSFRDKAPARAAGTDEPGKRDDRDRSRPTLN
jgi:hypothetical protein